MIIKQDIYNGALLHKRFAYQFFRKKVSAYGNIIAFKAPMKVEAEGMIDQEDILTADYIYSDLAINFCWEVPLIRDAFSSVLFQRLYIQGVGNILAEKYLKVPIEIDGDDLIVHKEHTNGGIVQPKGKASVSISCMRDGVGMGHLGINIIAGKSAPAFAYSTNMPDEQSTEFMNDGIKYFYYLLNDVFIATTKIAK